jgi:hypothetical protein
MADQDGMRAIGIAIAALAKDPFPAAGFHAGGMVKPILLSDPAAVAVAFVDTEATSGCQKKPIIFREDEGAGEHCHEGTGRRDVRFWGAVTARSALP